MSALNEVQRAVSRSCDSKRERKDVAPVSVGNSNANSRSRDSRRERKDVAPPRHQRAFGGIFGKTSPEAVYEARRESALLFRSGRGPWLSTTQQGNVQTLVAAEFDRLSFEAKASQGQQHTLGDVLVCRLEMLRRSTGHSIGRAVRVKEGQAGV